MNIEKYGFIFIIVGILMVFVSVILLFMASVMEVAGSKNIEIVGGGCIVIGFIPICIGTSAYITIIVMVLAIVMVIVFFSIFWLSRRELRKP